MKIYFKFLSDIVLLFKFEKKLKKILKIFLLFVLSLLIGCKEKVNNFDFNLEKSELDIKLAELNSKKYDSLIREEYEKLILDYYDKKDSMYYLIARDFEKNSRFANDTIGLISAQANLGQYFYNNFESDSSYYYYTKAEKNSLKVKGNPYLGSILITKSNILFMQRNYAQVQITAFKALKISKEKEYYDHMHSCYVLIASSLHGMNNSNQAIPYFEKALAISQKIPESKLTNILISATYSDLGKVYLKQNNYQKTIQCIEKGLSNKNIRQDDIKIYCYLKNILAKAIYKTQKNQALSIYTETLKIGDSLNFAPIQVASQLQLGEYYLFYKDTLKANSYLQKAKELAHQNQIFDDELLTLKLLSKSNPEKSNYYTDRYIHLNDSLQAVERATRDKFARIEFETDEISNQKDVIQLENKKLNTQLLLAIGFGLFVILSVYLWFRNKSIKSKIAELRLLQEKQELQNNKLLLIQEQQAKDEKIYQLILNQQQELENAKQLEKKRISRDLHDGIMGKLSGIRLNLYILKKKTDPETIAKCLEYVKEIQVIENDLRLLAHTLNKESITTLNGIENEINNIFNDIKNHQNIEFVLQMDKKIIWEEVNYVLKLNLYRIIQEALHNIDKYANAKQVIISITQKEQGLSIEIKDDGIGFDATQKKEGIGLKNMRERAEESGGTFSVETAPKKGTKINLLLPF